MGWFQVCWPSAGGMPFLCILFRQQAAFSPAGGALDKRVCDPARCIPDLTAASVSVRVCKCTCLEVSVHALQPEKEKTSVHCVNVAPVTGGH